MNFEINSLNFSTMPVTTTGSTGRCLSKAEHKQVTENVAKTATQVSEVTAVLDELQRLIFDTFERLGCSLKALEDMLGLNVDINVSNMVVYLGQIEQKANELLNILHYVNLKVGHSQQLSSLFCKVKKPPVAKILGVKTSQVNKKLSYRLSLIHI